MAASKLNNSTEDLNKTTTDGNKQTFKSGEELAKELRTHHFEFGFYNRGGVSLMHR